MTSFVLMNASFVLTKDAVDRGRVSCETSTSAAFVLTSDAFVSMNASLMRTSDAFVSTKTEHKASERRAKGQRETSEGPAETARLANERPGTERAKGRPNRAKASEN